MLHARMDKFLNKWPGEPKNDLTKYKGVLANRQENTGRLNGAGDKQSHRK